MVTLAALVFLLLLPLAPASAQNRPNVIVVMTDDQSASTMWAMPQTVAALGEHGTTFVNSFAVHPLCCPSRATFLTGQHTHNHGVITNHPPLGGYPRLTSVNTLPVWLQSTGYFTSFIGKYLNHYGYDNPTAIPLGWSDWQALVGPTDLRMYRYVVNDNGALVTYGDAESDYQTDVLRRRAVAVVASAPRPYFLWVATLAPHREGCRQRCASPRPAPRHAGRFATTRLPRGPAFNERDVDDKPLGIRQRPPLTAAEIARIQTERRLRAESLLAVDDLVADIVGAARDAGDLDNTVIVFTSDNGWLAGEHRLEGKNRVYEEAVRVPLLVRGPGFPAGAQASQLVGNIDLAPTIVELTGATAGLIMDGRSLLALARDPISGTGRILLLQRPPIGRSKAAFTAVRTDRYVYAEYTITGERELYDLAHDPHQLRSRHADPAYGAIREWLAGQLAIQRRCAANVCSWGRW
jgi:arylsulfatase A-like enzyme